MMIHVQFKIIIKIKSPTKDVIVIKLYQINFEFFRYKNNHNIIKMLTKWNLRLVICLFLVLETKKYNN